MIPFLFLFCIQAWLQKIVRIHRDSRPFVWHLNKKISAKKRIIPKAVCYILMGGSICNADCSVDSALQARAEGLPQITIVKLTQLLSEPSLDISKKNRILRELGRTYYEANRLDDAVRTLLPLTSDPTARFWLARTLADQGEYSKALAFYQDPPSSSDLQPYTALGAAQMLHALGRNTEALTALSKVPYDSRVALQATLERVNILLDLNRVAEAIGILQAKHQAASSPWGHYLAARSAMLECRWKAAAALLSDIQPTDNELIRNVLLSRAECSIQIGDLSSAENILTKFLEEQPQNPTLPTVFAKLDEVYSKENNPSSGDLWRWAVDHSHQFRAQYAKFYYARNELRMGHKDSALGLFLEFIRDLPQHPLADSARLELAQQYLELHQPQDVLEILTKLQPNSLDVKETAKAVEFLKGSAFFALNRYSEAAQAFFNAAQLDPSQRAESALYNAALSYLLAAPSNSSNDISNPAQLELMRRYPNGRAIKELRFVEALQKAKWKCPDAAQALAALAKSSSRAQLALTELYFLNGDIQAASHQWLRFADNPNGNSDRIAYLAIFLIGRDTEEADEQVIKLARNFLETFPNSNFKPNVRMKLGEIYFRRGNFLGARIQLESLAREFPDSPLAEAALFLAAQSSARTMEPSAIENAMLLFEEVAKMKGPFAWRARLEQARVQEIAGHPDQALLILKNVLAAQTDPDIHLEALMIRGNILFGQEIGYPANYAQAIQAWQQIVSDPNVTLPWKNQALTKIGAAYQKLGDSDKALASYYDVFNAPRATNPEFFWFYKAGFDAGKLCESKQQWNEAFSIYKQIASVPGPRVKEAEERIEYLKQAHPVERN